MTLYDKPNSPPKVNPTEVDEGVVEKNVGDKPTPDSDRPADVPGTISQDLPATPTEPEGPAPK